MDLLDCVAFILIEDNKFLAEKRKLTKEVDPGAIALPGGHMKNGENREDTLQREAREELSIIPNEVRYVCSLLHTPHVLHAIHYFVVESWTGEIENNEAESLQWIPLDDLEKLDLEIDRVAIREYLRVYK